MGEYDCDSYKDPELCAVGARLWCIATTTPFESEKYKDYVKHIIACDECVQGLGLDVELIRENLDLIMSAIDSIEVRTL